MTMRRYLVMVTPGMATGYWKAMNKPARARSSGSASVMSSPWKMIWPSVTSRPGWPMIEFARVDLPEPLGPISAWTSPLLTVRSRPLRICLSPACTCRLRISSSAAMKWLSFWVSGDGRGVLDGRDGLGLGRTVGEGDELGERRLGQRLDDAALDAGPQQLGGAAVAAVGLVVADDAAVRRLTVLCDEARHRRDAALEGEDDLVHVDLGGLARQAVAAVRAARGLDEAGLLEQGDDPLEVGEGQRLRLGDRLERDRHPPTRSPDAVVLATQLDEEPDPVLRLRREDHRS